MNKQGKQEEVESERLLNKIQAFAETILQKRDEAIAGRASSGVERRWREDEVAFDGLDEINSGGSMLDYATGDAYRKPNDGPSRSSVIVNIIRSKCEVAEGRFSDVQLPVDDRNWGLKTTPVPELISAMTSDQPALDQGGQEIEKPDKTKVTFSDVAKREIEEAKTKMRLMETEIDDQLTECNFNAESRKGVRDAVRLGTCVIKGPSVVKRLKKVWKEHADKEQTVHMLDITEDMKPASKCIDPWKVYPDPNCGDDIKRAAYIWEADTILPRELRLLIGVDGYLADQIYAAMEEEPKRTQVVENKHNQKIVQQNTAAQGAPYEIWEYHGDVNREDLEALGCGCEEFEDKSLSACVVFVNDRPVKARLNVIDTGDLPYDFFQWTTTTNSVWGIGIPRMMIWQQRIITSAWRAMMDNAGDSSGANVIVGHGVSPSDGVWELTGKKIWEAGSEVDDVRNAFIQFQIQNNQADLQNIIDLALKFVDMETGLPMLFQGEKAELPETLGATNIMVDSNNVSLRSRVKKWDDQITRPHITRFYHWNMQYNEKPDIKGDYNVDARGTSVLLAKDQQAQSISEVLELRNDPKIGDVIDWEKAIKQLFSARKLDVVLTDEEIAKNRKKREEAKPPVDPSIQGSIDVATIRAEGEMQKLERQQELEKEKLERQAVADEKKMAHEIGMKRLDQNMKMMELSSASGISLEKIKSELARDSAKLQLQERLSLQKAGEAIKPPVEVPGKAPDGESFVK